MLVDITVQEFKRCHLVAIKGRIDSSTAPQLEKALNSVTSNGHYKIVLNLSETLFLSSAGLRHVIGTQKECKRFNRGELLLSEVPEKMHEVFKTAGLTKVFKFYKTDAEAVGSF